MEGFCYYRPYVDPEFESLIERINPPRVCIDNDASKDCTLVKVDSANKHGILLEVVQMLTDLDLVISKSYICSDGGWFMDVFHVTDKFGNKITDNTLIHNIQQAICTKRNTKEAQVWTGKEVRHRYKSTDHTAIEMTVTDQPGLLSEISAVLAELGCHVTDAVAWTHNHRAACIIYMDDQEMGRPITDQSRLSHIQEQLQTVVEAHHQKGEKRSVKLTPPATAEIHTERRLHQLMVADEDYKMCDTCGASLDKEWIDNKRNHGISCVCTNVSVESCREKGYSVVNVRSKDRPKLLFDTVCALTDMQYMVFHAAISSNCSVAVQEYYVRHKDGCTLDTEMERHRVIQCLIAAVERRDAQGLRLDITAKDRLGLLSDVTRVFREHGLSVSRADVGTRGDKATGTFYVTDASGRKISQQTVDSVKREIGGSIQVYDYDKSSNSYVPSSSITSKNTNKSSEIDDRPALLSLGSLLWSQLERISSNWGSIKL